MSSVPFLSKMDTERARRAIYIGNVSCGKSRKLFGGVGPLFLLGFFMMIGHSTSPWL